VVSVYRFDTSRVAEGTQRFSVYVDVPGFAVECIDGSPDDSIWRVILGDI
jgi:hypothetical protein